MYEYNPYDIRINKMPAWFLRIEAYGLAEAPQVESVQEKVQVALHEYLRAKVGGEQSATRFGRLLLRLPALKQVTARSLEQLFFVRLVGSTPVEALLRDILLNGPSLATPIAPPPLPQWHLPALVVPPTAAESVVPISRPPEDTSSNRTIQLLPSLNHIFRISNSQ